METLTDVLAVSGAAILVALFVGAATVPLFVGPSIPPEQKVVEIHMTRKAVSKVVRTASIDLPLLGHGTCSGEFIDTKGDILTAKHCVDGFDAFEVQTSDQAHYNAVVVARSPAHDLALLHIDRSNTPYFRLANKVTRGETVFALGSPLGITNTLTTGIVARLDGDSTLLDCGVLPGNSGGPVFDSDGKLIGVVSAGYIVMFGTTHLNIAQGLDTVRFFLRTYER